MELTADQVHAMMPGCSLQRAKMYLAPLNAALKKAEINNVARVAAFIAQVGHESLNLTFMAELATGEAYEGRKDLGNVIAGDGRRFKGRGPIQLTGRANYTAFGAWAGIDCVSYPHMLEEPQWGFLASAWFWKDRGLNTLADEGDIKAVSIRINGRGKNGFPNGWADRQARYALALEVLS